MIPIDYEKFTLYLLGRNELSILTGAT
jgi:hypothetical protein